MKVPSFVVCFIALTIPALNSYSQEKTFREKMRERILERMQKRKEEKPSTVITSTDTKITKAGDYTMSFSHNGIDRKYIIHVPANYNPTNPTSLLVALHGGGGNMEYEADDKKYKLISKSESAGFIVLFPNGFSRFGGKLATWNAGKCCAAARDNNIDDVGFIKEMINKTTAQLNIDRNKVFATGMSNGGMMSYRLACELSDTIKAIASVAGTDNTVHCSPKNPISILHIHAKNDDHVQFNGGAGPKAGIKSTITDYVSVPATISKWVEFNSCDKTPKRVLEVSGAYCDLYSKCKNNVEVKLCVTETGGHSWPGGEKGKGEPASTAISADDVMWEFFSSN